MTWGELADVICRRMDHEELAEPVKLQLPDGSLAASVEWDDRYGVLVASGERGPDDVLGVV
jgi:hypothetical protein